MVTKSLCVLFCETNKGRGSIINSTYYYLPQVRVPLTKELPLPSDRIVLHYQKQSLCLCRRKREKWTSISGGKRSIIWGSPALFDVEFANLYLHRSVNLQSHGNKYRGKAGRSNLYSSRTLLRFTLKTDIIFPLYSCSVASAKSSRHRAPSFISLMQ